MFIASVPSSNDLLLLVARPEYPDDRVYNQRDTRQSTDSGNGD
jgi:hypothetical protein